MNETINRQRCWERSVYLALVQRFVGPKSKVQHSLSMLRPGPGIKMNKREKRKGGGERNKGKKDVHT